MDNRQQYADLFRAEYPGLVGELSLILGDRALAEEVAAEAFVELWRKWTRVAGYNRPGAWVRHVALRKAGRARWRRSRRQVVEAIAFEQGAPPPNADMDLANALRQLPAAQRTAVVLHHLRGWPTADIAMVLGCADVTVRSHLSRGRQQLAVLLAPSNSESEADDVDPY